jgi:hypothetical protein
VLCCQVVQVILSKTCLNSIVVAASSSRVRSIIDFARVMIFLAEGSSSSSESDTSAFLPEVDRETGRERLVRGRKALKSVVMHQAWRVYYRRKFEANGKAEHCRRLEALTAENLS